MSKLLKRPMFRKGGAVEDGIMKLATGGRAKYAEAGPVIDPNDPLLKDAQRREALLTKFSGAPSDTKQDLYDLLISGGLNLVGGVGAGDGTLASVARSFKEPTEKFLAKRPSEEAYKRQLKLAAAQGALSAEDAEKLAKIKIKEKTESSLQKDYSPQRIFYETYKQLTDPKAAKFGGGTIQQRYPEAFSEFAAYIAPAIRKNEKLKSSFIGTVPVDKKGDFVFSEMVGGGIYFKPDTKKLYQRDPEKNILIEYDPYTGKKLKELSLKQ
jgi:hypothetical protein